MNKGKIFGLLSVGALMVGGFFVAQNINNPSVSPTQQIVSTQTSNTITPTAQNDEESSLSSYYFYDVILVDFNDATCINGRLNKTLEDYIQTYNQVSDYIYELSAHKARSYYNFYTCKLDVSAKDLTHSTSTNFYSHYNNILNNKQPLQQNYSNEGTCIFQFASLYSVQYSEFAWPAYFSNSVCYSIKLIDETISQTILHETLHSLGLPDLYSNANKADCSLSYDIMSCDYNINPVLNAYMREYKKWISSSNYNDSNLTEIENITESGRYRLYYPEILGQTIAYSFGTKGKETFYIEARNPLYPKTLLVNRVYKTKQKNIEASDRSQCYVIDIAQITNDKGLISNLGTPKNKDVIYYASGEVANFAIGHVEFFDDYIEFDFSTTGNFGFQTEINVIDTQNNPLANALVYVNDNLVGKTNEFGCFSYKVFENDAVTILHPDTKNALSHTMQYKEKSVKFTFESVKQTIKENDNTQTNANNTNNAQIFTLNIDFEQILKSGSSGSNFFVIYENNFTTSTSVQVYVDNQLVSSGLSKTCAITLKNNSYLTIYAVNQTFTYIFEEDSKTLIDTTTGQRIYCQNQAFSVILKIQTIQYHLVLNYEDNPSKYAGIKSIKAYNAVSGIWVTLNCWKPYSEENASLLYLTRDYTQIEVEYQNWYEWNTITFSINPYDQYYSAKLSQNIIQSGLDWWSNLFN